MQNMLKNVTGETCQSTKGMHESVSRVVMKVLRIEKAIKRSSTVIMNLRGPALGQIERF